jgi:Oxysterol-binding protein
LTRISLPAAVFLPLSALELAARANLNFSTLLELAAACSEEADSAADANVATNVGVPPLTDELRRVLRCDETRPVELARLLMGLNGSPSPPPSDVLRCLLVAKYYVLCLGRDEFEKKPFNPVLGETHELETARGTTFLGEQVSHHPPVSAFVISNPAFTYTSNFQMETHFATNSVSVTVTGESVIQLQLPSGAKESYKVDVPLPQVTAHGVLIGRRRSVFAGMVNITCLQTGVVAQLEFADRETKPAGWLSKAVMENTVEGSVGVGRDVIRFRGLAGQNLVFSDGSDGQFLSWERVAELRQDLLVPARALAKPHESTHMWEKAAAAIMEDDLPTADAEKHIVEEAQRAERAQRHATGERHSPRHFTFVPNEDDATLVDGDAPPEVLGKDGVTIITLETGKYVPRTEPQSESEPA